MSPCGTSLASLAIPAIGVEHRVGERRVGVADAAVRAAAEDLAVVASRISTPGSAWPSVVSRLTSGSSISEAGDRRVLGAAVRAEHLDAESVTRSLTATGTGEPPRPPNGIEREMLVREVRMVEQAGEEVRGATGHAEVLLAHQAQDLARIPHVDEMDRPVAQQRDEERVDHADEMADRAP